MKKSLYFWLGVLVLILASIGVPPSRASTCIPGTGDWQYVTTNIYRCGVIGFGVNCTNFYSTLIYEIFTEWNTAGGQHRVVHQRWRTSYDTSIHASSDYTNCMPSSVTETNYDSGTISPDMYTCSSETTDSDSESLDQTVMQAETAINSMSPCVGSYYDRITTQLEDVYSAGQLVDTAKGLARNLDWIDAGSSAIAHAIWGSEVVVTPRPSHGASVQLARYRVKFEGLPGMEYTVSWRLKIIEYNEVSVATNTYESPVITEEHVVGTGENSSTSWREFLEPSFGQRLGATVIDIDIVPEESGCCGGPGGPGGFGGSPGTGPAYVRSALFDISLGAGNVEGGVGILRMHEEVPSETMATPEGLQFLVNPDVVKVVTNADLSIHVAAPTLLARIAATNDYAYWIHFSVTNTGAGNFLTNAPFISHLIINPNGATDYNTLRQIQYRSGNVLTNEFVCETNNATNVTWRLTSGNGLKGERLARISYTNTSTRLESYSIFTPSNSVQLFKRDKLYLDLPLGDILLSETIDPQGLALTTTNTYDAYGRIQLSLRPDGSWERSEYNDNGWLIRVVRPLTNQPPTASTNDCRVTEYSYESVSGSPDSPTTQEGKPRTVWELVRSEVVSKTMYAYSGYDSYVRVAATASAGWTDGDNENSKTTENADHRPIRIDSPDGTYVTYTYTDDSSGLLTVASYHDSDTVEFRRTEDQVNTLGQPVSHKTYDYTSGSSVLVDQALYSDNDEFLRPTKITYLDTTTSVSVKQDCCNASYTIDRDGIASTNLFDALKRTISTTRSGITHSNVLDAADRTLAQFRQGTNGNLITLRNVGYDAASRVIAETNALGYFTSYSYVLNSSNQMVITTTHPDGGTRIETHSRDGAVESITGTAAFPVRYEYGVEADGAVQRPFSKEIKLDSAGSDTSEWTKTYTDFFGRNYKTLFAGSSAPYSQSYFNEKGQQWKTRDPDGITTLFKYNNRGERAYTWVDEGHDDLLFFNLSDRVSEVTNFVASAHSTSVHRTETYQWLTNSSTTRTLVSTVERSVDGLKSWAIRGGAESSTIKSVPSSGAYTVTQTAPEGSYSVAVYQAGRLASVTRYNSGGTSIGSTTYGYDSHGRQSAVTDARTGTTTFTYNNADQIVSVTTPPAGTGGSAQTTTTTFDSMGRATSIVQADGTTVNNVFSKRGELVLTSGSRNYPVGYNYDAQGRMKNMTNWSTFSSLAGSRVTSWHYHPERGWLTNKLYADGLGTKYSYTAAGRLSTRLWARGITTSYTYDELGGLQQVSYDDGVTPTVDYTYTRDGKQETISRGSDSWKLFYNTNGQLISERGTAGVLNGLRVTNIFDQYLRRTNVSSANGSSILTTNGYTFDTAGRLSTARDGTYVATYSYLANSPLVSQIVLSSNGTTRLTTTRTYDNLNRLQSISSKTNGTSISIAGYTYSYNDANQRTRVNLADGSFWVYEYDSLGQVTSGKRYWSDWTPVAGQQFEYGFDDIGNRNSTKTGGDSAGGSLRSASYTNNTLNQITGRDIPAYLNVIGAASATATNVNVNNTMAYRKGEYYRVELNPNNAPSAVWQSVTNRVVQNGTTNSVTGSSFLPKQAEAFSYDADGNLTNDGRWAYLWDAENRLIRQFGPTTGPSGSVKALTFGYDWQGRRISKTVSNWSGSAWSKVIDEKYLYDGWNQLTSLNASNNAVVRGFLWGSDLSGSMQGAGGVGGLLAVNAKGSSVTFPAYDGNGNVTALIDAAEGNRFANYDYGPFGEVIRASGTAAKTNPFRFSTKFQDEETDQLYYGYRFYNPSTGRWLSRDPIEEDGGANLYAFLQNSLGEIDYLGLEKTRHPIGYYCSAAAEFPQNRWLKCACEVSRQIESGWQALVYVALVSPRDSPAYKRSTSIGGWYDCMRTCMVEKWRVAHKKWEGGSLTAKEQKSLTSAWKGFCDECTGAKVGSKKCCEKQVRAEQLGFEECTEKCGKWKSEWGPPGFGLMKGWDYEKSDFNNVEDRIRYGNARCCSGSSASAK